MTTLAVSATVVGCTADEQPAGSDERAQPTVSPAVEAQGPTMSPPPSGAMPYDESTAPAAFTDRTALRNCGAVLDIHNAWPSPATPHQEADSAVRDCFRKARAQRMGAEVRIVAPSTDSGPIFYYVRTTDTGAAEAWMSSKDRMAGPDAPVVWRRQTCAGVEPRNLVPVDCTEA
jgi:hypothetical protein